MKKSILFTILMVLTSISISAKQISEAEAMAIATNFTKTAIAKNTALKDFSKKSISIEKSTAPTDKYYVFNFQDKNGFVIIAGDDEVPEILGYTDNGTFNYNDCPDNMKVWLDTYAEQIEALQQGKAKLLTEYNVANTSAVAPLISSKWGQSAPYNNLCPMDNSTGDRTVTGCVATSMAQVMYYYKYPAKGKGSKTYTTPKVTGEISFDYDNTPFDWDNITDTYGSNSTDAENTAVATLMKACGVTADMEYSSDVSLTSSFVGMRKGMIEYLNFNKNMYPVTRDCYNSIEWEKLLKNELNNARPILYSAQTSTGGHSFICDGYNADGLFHINWGWNGSYDGYFKIAILDPYNTKENTTDGYTKYQSAMINVKPDIGETQTVKTYMLHSSDNVDITIGNYSAGNTVPFKLNLPIENLGYESFTGNCYLAFRNKTTQNLDAKIIIFNNITLKSLEATVGFSSSFSMPALSNGEYELCFVSEDNKGDILPINLTLDSSEYTVSVNNDIATIDKFIFNSNLRINNITVNKADDSTPIGMVYNKKTMKITFDVTNNGEEYYNKYGYIISNGTIENRRVIIGIFEAGETLTVTDINALDIKDFTPGYYTITFYDDYIGNPISESIEIYIADEDGEPDVQVDAFTMDSELSSLDDVTVNVSFKNNGGFFNEKIYGVIFPSETDTNFSCYANSDEMVVPANGTASRTLNFHYDINLPDGKYYMRLCNAASHELTILSNGLVVNNIPFTIKTSGVENVASDGLKLEVYPNPANSYININSNKEDILKVNIYDLLGKQVLEATQSSTIDISSLNAGHYFIQVTTLNGEVKSHHFIKE